MLPELAHYAIILALFLALAQVIVPMIGVVRNDFIYMQVSRYTAFGQFLFLGFGIFALAYSFLINDFSIAYVAENSNTHLPAIYRFCAVWGAHEGSLLLWVFILSVWTVAVSVFSKSLPLEMLARILAVLALISIGFELFILTTSDPFQRFLPDIPVDGRDLNPILQDPGLVIHPPMLYMGYVGFSVAFAFSIAALMSKRLDGDWAKWTRPWTIVAWCFLTYGIVSGSWWAYRELGWGGWWFWDPVENASFLPWLAGTALIHSLIVTEKRNVFKAWTALLAVCAFSLSLMGTFLVRSGVLISVHAFAVDPKRGLFMLNFLLIVVGGSLALYGWRGRHIVNTGNFNFWSRETMLLANNVLLFVAMLTVLLGTLYPLIIEALHLGKISVGAPYFNTVFIPLISPLLLLMGIGPLFRWQDTDPQIYIKRFLILSILIATLSYSIPILAGYQFKFSVFFGLILAFWIIVHTLSHLVQWNKNKNSFQISLKKLSIKQYSMIIAHIGVAVTVIGIVLTIAYSQELDLKVHPGETVNFGEYQFRFEDIYRSQGPNYTAITAKLSVLRHNVMIEELYPELRTFPLAQTTMAKTAINVGLFRDIYVALGERLANNNWELRIYNKPFVRWIWCGGLLMMLGGLIALLSSLKRKRTAL